MDFAYVTINDYERFMTATHYVPDLDVLEGNGTLLTDARLNFGRAIDVPIVRLSFRDSLAYANWSGLRIPTASELEQFFTGIADSKKAIKWHFFYWTCTEAAGKTVVLNGPYFWEQKLILQKRMVVPPEYLDEFEPIALRLCKAKEESQ